MCFDVVRLVGARLARTVMPSGAVLEPKMSVKRRGTGKVDAKESGRAGSRTAEQKFRNQKRVYLAIVQ